MESLYSNADWIQVMKQLQSMSKTYADIKPELEKSLLAFAKDYYKYSSTAYGALKNWFSSPQFQKCLEYCASPEFENIKTKVAQNLKIFAEVYLQILLELQNYIRNLSSQNGNNTETTAEDKNDKKLVQVDPEALSAITGNDIKGTVAVNGKRKILLSFSDALSLISLLITLLVSIYNFNENKKSASSDHEYHNLLKEQLSIEEKQLDLQIKQVEHDSHILQNQEIILDLIDDIMIQIDEISELNEQQNDILSQPID